MFLLVFVLVLCGDAPRADEVIYTASRFPRSSERRREWEWDWECEWDGRLESEGAAPEPVNEGCLERGVVRECEGWCESGKEGCGTERVAGIVIVEKDGCLE